MIETASEEDKTQQTSANKPLYVRRGDGRNEDRSRTDSWTRTAGHDANWSSVVNNVSPRERHEDAEDEVQRSAGERDEQEGGAGLELLLDKKHGNVQRNFCKLW